MAMQHKGAQCAPTVLGQRLKPSEAGLSTGYFGLTCKKDRLTSNVGFCVRRF